MEEGINWNSADSSPSLYVSFSSRTGVEPARTVRVDDRRRVDSRVDRSTRTIRMRDAMHGGCSLECCAREPDAEAATTGRRSGSPLRREAHRVEVTGKEK